MNIAVAVDEPGVCMKRCLVLASWRGTKSSRTLLGRWKKTLSLVVLYSILNFTKTSESDTLKVAFVRGGHHGKRFVQPLLRKAFPGKRLVYSENLRDVGSLNVDLVVEGPSTFSRISRCADPSIPWIQVVGEPSSHYDESKWCPHAEASLVRIDTVRSHEKNISAETTFLWAPYACEVILEAKVAFTQRVISNFSKRRHLVAWLSSQCVKTRNHFWQSLISVARERGVGGLHSLGKCEHNHNLPFNRGRKNGWRSNHELYSNYKFVLVMENTLEKGYVTEKLSTALRAGSIPIFYGDADAHAIFNSSSFIDIRQLARTMGFRMNGAHVAGELRRVSDALLDIILSQEEHKNYLMANVLKVHPYSKDGIGDNVFPPECRFISENEIEHSYNRGSIKQAVVALQRKISRKAP